LVWQSSSICRALLATSHDRRDFLPALAAERIPIIWQLDLAPEQFIVIGDTPNDIACAATSARAFAVGTGASTVATTFFVLT